MSLSSTASHLPPPQPKRPSTSELPPPKSKDSQEKSEEGEVGFAIQPVAPADYHGTRTLEEPGMYCNIIKKYMNTTFP